MTNYNKITTFYLLLYFSFFSLLLPFSKSNKYSRSTNRVIRTRSLEQKFLLFFFRNDQYRRIASFQFRFALLLVPRSFKWRRVNKKKFDARTFLLRVTSSLSPSLLLLARRSTQSCSICKSISSRGSYQEIMG